MGAGAMRSASADEEEGAAATATAAAVRADGQAGRGAARTQPPAGRAAGDQAADRATPAEEVRASM